jgi:hypothetical protein
MVCEQARRLVSIESGTGHHVEDNTDLNERRARILPGSISPSRERIRRFTKNGRELAPTSIFMDVDKATSLDSTNSYKKQLHDLIDLT